MIRHVSTSLTMVMSISKVCVWESPWPGWWACVNSQTRLSLMRWFKVSNMSNGLNNRSLGTHVDTRTVFLHTQTGRLFSFNEDAELWLMRHGCQYFPSLGSIKSTYLPPLIHTLYQACFILCFNFISVGSVVGCSPGGSFGELNTANADEMDSCIYHIISQCGVISVMQRSCLTRHVLSSWSAALSSIAYW